MKKLCFLCMWLLACAGALYAREFKEYSNDKTGWSGYLAIDYIGEMEKDRWERKTTFEAIKDYYQSDSRSRLRGGVFVPVTKLSQREKWLIQQALGEYDVADKEVYIIVIGDPKSFDIVLQSFPEMVIISVRIKNNGRSFDFRGVRWLRD